MTCTVQLFAGARDAAGRADVALSLPEPATVGDLRRELGGAFPGLQRFGPRLWIAVNGQYAADADAVPAGAEVACFPPVSGG